MEWYKSLDINTRINAKSCFELACGLKFEDLAFLFSFRERIDMLYNKLKLENIL
jgi:hypothetical protein